MDMSKTETIRLVTLSEGVAGKIDISMLKTFAFHMRNIITIIFFLLRCVMNHKKTIQLREIYKNMYSKSLA